MTHEVGDPLKPNGYTFIVMRSTTGVAHLMYATGRWLAADGITLCQHRRVPNEWTPVSAKDWYEGNGRCCDWCRAKIGPWATVKL